MKRLSCPERAPSGIALYQIDFDLERPLAADDWVCLSIDEQVRASHFHRYQDRVRFGVMRATLRRLLGQRLSCTPQEVHLELNQFGKPCLAGGQGAVFHPRFNLTHTGAIGLLALSEGQEVGIDIEYCDTVFTPAELAGVVKQVLSQSELQQVGGNLAQDQFFTRWVGKEAALKALGVGIGEHLQTLSVWPASGGAYAVSHDHPTWPVVCAHRLDSPPGYAAALAWLPPEVSN